MALVVAGLIVAMGRQDPQAQFAGRVYIDDSGAIVRITPGNTGAPAGFTNAPVIDVGDSFVLPGFIDLHNHIGYNTLPLWAEPAQSQAWTHHKSWTRAPSYASSISWPANALVQAAPEATLAYVQLRAMVGGTTAIQGWPTANRAHVQVLRDIDGETANTTNQNLIFTSTLTLDPLALAKKAQAVTQGAGFIYHCGEGQTGSIVAREFVDAANAGCLERTMICIHCNSLSAADWKRWPKAKAGAVVWSPFSNLWLYGQTTDIQAARAQDIHVCIGSDWGPSGTKNVQGEIKVAKLVSQKQGFSLTDQELVAMITTNPGDTLSSCWHKTVGRLEEGAFADLTVLRRKGNASVWAQVVASTELDVQLVVSKGITRYGDAALLSVAQQVQSSPITIAGIKRRFAIADPDHPELAWSWADIQQALNTVRKDPVAALARAQGARRAFAGPMNDPQAPLILALDMPTGASPMAGDVSAHAAQIVIPPLPTLIHDKAFFGDIRGRGFHGGLLDGLAPFYV